MSALRRVVLFLVCYFAILVVASKVKQLVPVAFGPLAWGVVSAAVLYGMTLLFTHRDGRTARDVGAKIDTGSAWRLLLGIAIGVAVYLLTLLVIRAAAGPIVIARASSVSLAAVALAVGTYLALSSMEELGFRGYALRTLDAQLGLWPALAITALAFALSHLAFGWPWQALLFGVLPSAVLFGMAAIASRGLAMPIGVHAGVNLASWAFGEKDTPGLFTVTVPASATASLGSVAPVSGVIVTLGAAVAFWSWHRWRSAAKGTP